MDIKALSEMAPWEWPKDAGVTFLRVVKDKGASGQERVMAASMAGDLVVIDDDIARTLLSVVRDPAETAELRHAAAIALGPVLEHAFTFEFDDPDDVPISEAMYVEIQNALRKVHMDSGVPPEVRRGAFEGSVRAPDEWHKAAIRAMYSNPDKPNVRSAVFAMGFVRGFDSQIIESLGGGDPEIVYQAVVAAGNWELRAAWPRIAQILDDPRADRDLLLAAIEAAPWVNRVDGSLRVKEFLESDDEEIAEAAQEALVTAGRVACDVEDEPDEEDLR